MKGRHIVYRPEELAWIKVRAELPRREMWLSFCEVWGRDDVRLSNINALCKRQGWMTGRTGYFTKGTTPHNKGHRMAPEVRARCAGTMFRKGNKSGRAEAMEKPLGYERLTPEGYIQRKVNNDRPFNRRWKLVHRINWEAVNGPVPNGYALKCRDGNKANVAAENWEAIPRALLPRLAGGRWGRMPYDHAEPEVRPAILAIARIEHAARKVRG